MGVRSAPVLRDRLLAAGADPDAPVVIVENGTLPREQTLATTLALLPQAIAAKGLHGPAIIFVGLDWSAAGLARPASVETFSPQMLRLGATAPPPRHLRAVARWPRLRNPDRPPMSNPPRRRP